MVLVLVLVLVTGSGDDAGDDAGADGMVWWGCGHAYDALILVVHVLVRLMAKLMLIGWWR